MFADYNECRNYNALLYECGTVKATGIHNKHLKQLISTHIREAEFVKSHRVYKREQVVNKNNCQKKN